MSAIENEANTPEKRSSAILNEEAVSIQEKTAHQIAERGNVATDQ